MKLEPIPDKVIEAFNSVTPEAQLTNGEAMRCWRILFAFYNKQFPDMIPLSMGCRPCFRKVYFYIQQQISIEETF